MTDPERGDEGGAGENLHQDVDKESTGVDLNDHNPDDSKIGLINANGGAGTDHVDVRIHDPAAASSDGEVSFNGLGKDEVMRYADEPFWKRLRLILFALFWIGWFAMLITAVVIIALAPRCPPRPDLKWYQKESVYQVVPKSFKDSNADGIGDLEGLKTKMSYIEGLGSKAVWLSGIYKVQDNEGMHVIMNHKETREDFGTVAALKAWIKKMAKEGKRIILDLVPNQTSKKHEWFMKSQKKDGKYADYYIWRNGNSSGPPNKWKTQDNQASAWSKDNVRGDWYFHQNDDQSADLNLENPDVVEEIKNIMKFWLDAGVGGFHVCDVDLLLEDLDNDAGNPKNITEGTRDFLVELRTFIDGYNKPGRERFLFATVNDNDGHIVENFFGNAKKGLNMVMPVLAGLDRNSDAKSAEKLVKKVVLVEAESGQGKPWIGLGLGDQFTNRVASRMNKNENKLNAAHALQLLMPGSPFIYYGDEFGQFTGEDPSVTSAERLYSPMQWNNQEYAGFSTTKPWQNPGSQYKTNNVQAGTAHFTSSTPLKVFKDLVKLRQEPSFQWGKTKVCTPNKSLFMFSRKATRFPYYVTMINMDTSGLTLTVSLSNHECVDSKPEGTVVFHSGDSDQVGKTLNFHDHPASIKSGELVVIEFAADE